MRVFCCAAGKSSLYIPLLFQDILEEFQPELGHAAQPKLALQAVRQGEKVLMHIHWEEFFLQKAVTAEEARGRALLFQEEMRALRRAGARTFWTIHNLLPHRVPHIEPFLDIRRFLADFADGILVHDASAVEMLKAQVDLPAEKIFVLPHPSYTGLYEPEEAAWAAVGGACDRTLLCFGSVRLQKNIGGFIDMLPEEFLAARGARIKVSGAGPEAQAVHQRHAHRADVAWDLRYVPMEEAPALIRGSACVVLPYARFLTSGVALLVLSVGGLLVAADAPQLREILPAQNHRFLHRPDDAEDLRRVIDEVLALSGSDRAAACRANLEAAQRYAPAIIGARLAAYYDSFGVREARPPQAARATPLAAGQPG